jgi:hypothetical protein
MHVKFEFGQCLMIFNEFFPLEEKFSVSANFYRDVCTCIRFKLHHSAGVLPENTLMVVIE